MHHSVVMFKHAYILGGLRFMAPCFEDHIFRTPGLEVIKLEYSLKLKIERNDWLLADLAPRL